jgi:carboxymethylenebutenolidase
MGEYVSNGQVNGWLARPKDETGVGMLLLPHVQGIDHAMKNEDAQGFADAGYTTFVWDPYPGFDVESGKEPPRYPDERAVTDQIACVDYILSGLGVRRLGMIGWCMGGRMALNLAAREHRLVAAVAYYPSIRDPRPEGVIDAVAEAAKITCPLQVIYPGKDHVTSNETFAALQASLDKCSGAVTVHVYPDAVHGFMSRMDQSEANRQAGDLAWPQTMAFLHATVRA